MIYFHLYSPNW